MSPSVEALFIKLGSKGEWEEHCLTHGVLRLGYGDTPHDACIAGRWGEVEEALRATSKSPGAATRHLQQIQSFYEVKQRGLTPLNPPHVMRQRTPGSIRRAMPAIGQKQKE